MVVHNHLASKQQDGRATGSAALSRAKAHLLHEQTMERIHNIRPMKRAIWQGQP